MEQKLDKKKYLKRVIIVSWIGLAICFVIKLFGGNLFEIACENERFIAICDYADTNLWLNYIISAVYCFISLYFFTLSILQRIKYKLWQFIIILITVLVGTAIKVFWNKTAGLVFDVWQGIIMPMIFLGKDFKSYWKIVVANLFLVAFQLISMYIKGIETTIVYESGVLISFIYGIDVLLMEILYFCYVQGEK